MYVIVSILVITANSIMFNIIAVTSHDHPHPPTHSRGRQQSEEGNCKLPELKGAEGMKR